MLALFGCLRPGVSLPLPAVSQRRAARGPRGCRRTSGALPRLRARRQPAGGAPAPARPGPGSRPFPNLFSYLFLNRFKFSLLKVPLACIWEWLFHKTPQPFYIYSYGYLVVLLITSYGLLGHHNPCIIFLIDNVQEIDPELILTMKSLRGK